MPRSPVAFIAPLSSPFEAKLGALTADLLRAMGWKRVEEELGDLRQMASGVSPEELAQNQYTRRLLEIRNMWGGDFLPQLVDRVLLVWLKNGAVFSERHDDFASESLVWVALENAAELIDALPGNPAWDKLTAETEFTARKNGRLAAAVQFISHEDEQSMVDEIDAQAKNPSGATSFWGMHTSEKALRDMCQRRRDAVALIERSDEMGRLRTLKDSGRGEAWLLHCLNQGNEPLLRRALDAGLRLDNASAAAVQAFLGTQHGANPTAPFKAESFLRAHGYSVAALKKSERKEWESLVERDLGLRWETWEKAVAAGLPKLDAEPSAPASAPRGIGKSNQKTEEAALWVDGGAMAQESGWSRQISLYGQDLFAAMVQEILRAERLSAESRKLWTRLCAQYAWPAQFSEKAGAASGESAMAWALKRGALNPSDFKPGEFLEALQRDGGGPLLGEMILDFANFGEKIDLSAPGKHELTLSSPTSVAGSPLAWMLNKAENPAALSEGLRRLGLDFTEKSPDGKTFSQTLLSTGRARDAEAALAAWRDMEKTSPGSALALIETLDQEGATSLHWAARALELPAMRLCVALGANVNARDKKGQTILHWAAKKFGAKAERKFTPIIEFLRDSGFDWSAADKKGDTGIAALAKKGPVDALVKAIETAPETVLAKNHQGQTVMEHLSSRQGAGAAVAQAEGALMREEIKRASANAQEGEPDGSATAKASPKKRSGRRI